MRLSAARRSLFALLTLLPSLIGSATAADDNTQYVTATVDGQQVRVKDSRQPSLYTGSFGDCLGTGGALNVTRFDAAYYQDNMTVLFHLGAETALTNESIMMYIGVFAYGESRFDLTFNPCSANIASACPIKAGTPIEANGVIPISQNDIAGIPSIAYSIPDFEGQAILRIFANSTQSEIGCFSAVVTNGQTFSQQAAVGSVLGIFTVIALIASFATAIYGNHISEMRKHYAHSLSVLVVFAVWHHIFYSGALSMNWPSVLVAWWSNFAWAGGMIYSESMQNSINNFIGSNKGNTSHVGAAGTGSQSNGVGGGYDVHSIYKRDVFPNALNVPGLMKRSKFNRVARHVEQTLAKRELANSTDGFSWYGSPVKPGLPLPGNYSGFAGTLAVEDIPASNAFMTGFLWFLILLVVVTFSVVAFKFILEGMSKGKMIKADRLMFFRTHWIGYTALVALRTLFIGFFMMMFLCLFQFTYLASPGPTAIAVIVFLIMFVGLGSVAAYACFYRIKFGNYMSEPARVNLQKTKIMKIIPWYTISPGSEAPVSEDGVKAGSLRWWRVRMASTSEKSIHDDEDYTKKFGWLASRFRRTRWWFFVVWMFYEFIRACFLAGASGHPMTQVFGLLAVEFLAFIGLIITRPFEGQRLNTIVVYCLGFSKVTTVALSAAFDTSFNLARILTTVIGVVIIVIQGILMIIVVIAIIVGAVSSYMSVMRNREQIHPTKWNPWRERYFKHIDANVLDVPHEKPVPTKIEEPQEPKGPYFNVNSIKRMPKVEDEDREFVDEINADQDPVASQMSLDGAQGDVIAPTTRGRAPSIRSNMSRVSHTSLPYGARVHRASWSSRDFSEHFDPERQRARGQSLTGRDRPASRSFPRVDTNVGNSTEQVNRVPSPVSPVYSPPPSEPGHIPSPPPMRSMSRASSMKSNKSRPHLPTLMSANEIPPVPQNNYYGHASQPSGSHN